MNHHPLRLSNEELQRRREEIQHGLSRVNTALLAIVGVVIGLALAGIFAAYHASQRAEQARAANYEAQEDLWKSYLAQAMANRLNAVMGRKAEGERIIAAASAIRPSIELRNEAIAHMALTDFYPEPGKIIRPSAFVFNSDLSCYASADNTGLVQVWHLPEHQLLFEWRPTNGSAGLVALNRNGQYLLEGRHGTGFQLIDLKAGTPAFKTPDFLAFDFSPDGRTLVLLTNENTMCFIENASGRESRPALHLAEAIRDVGFNPARPLLAVNVGQGVQLWDWQAGVKLGSLEHGRPITCLAQSENYLAVGDEAGAVQVWDLRSKRSRQWIAHTLLVDALLFNHAGDLLVSDSWDGSCRVWNPTGNLILSTTDGFGFAFSQDDTRLGYGIRSSSRRGWGFWQVSKPRGFRTLDWADDSSANGFDVDFSPDGRLLVMVKDGGLNLVDLASGRSLATVRMRRARTPYFVDGGKSLLACGDDRLSVWPLESEPGAGGAIHLGQPRHISLPKTGHVDSAVMSRDRRRVALPLTDRDVAVFNLDDPAHPVLLTNGDCPKAPALSPDGKWVVTGTFHGRGAVVWDAISGRKLLDLDTGNSNPVFSPGGQILVVAGDREYRIFESGSWKLLRRIPTGSVIDLPACAAFSRDGRLLALVKKRHLIQLLDAQTWTELASLAPPNPQIITSLTFNEDGSLLAAGTATDAEAVQIWDLRALHRELAALGLDWSLSTEQKTAMFRGDLPVPATLLPFRSAQFIFCAVAAVALAIFCAWIVLRRQRQLFRAYLEVDDLMAQSNRELEIAHTEIMHSQKMKALGTLAAGIAHDFNNLLSVIRMSNKLIGRQAAGNAELQENVAEVEKAVEQGKSTVRSMLGYSRQTSGNGSLSLLELVEDTVGLLSRQFLTGIALDLELDRETAPLQLSRARVEQILLNLIVNAAEAMEGKGRLHIRVRNSPLADGCSIRAPREAASYVELTVADSGCGISPEVLPRIFEAFFTTKVAASHPGAGLGLSMVYSIAEQDGLGIGVETSPGKGATFRILMPVDKAH